MNINILIAFYSRYGNVAALAEAIAEGARDVEGAEVRLRRTHDLAPMEVINADERWKAAHKIMTAKYPEPTNDDALWADAIILGTPTRFGNPSAEIKLFVDKMGPLWVQGKLVDKIGNVFTSTSTPHGGNESTIITMLNPFMHFGMIIVTPGYTDPVFFETAGPYGATSVSGPDADRMPTEKDLTAARITGKRVAERALIFKMGKQSLEK